MILSDIIGMPATGPDGHRAGWIIDVRFTAKGRSGGPMTLYGLIISPRAATSLLGYERTEMDAPGLIYRALRWRHRGSFLVKWEDIAQFGSGMIRLREGYTCHPVRLDDDDTAAAAARQRGS